MSVSRNAVGSYSVTLGTVLNGGGHVQVTAYGKGNSYCNVVSWGKYTAKVRCFDNNGRATDSRFSALALSPGAIEPMAYAWADNPNSARYLASTVYAHSDKTSSVSISRSGTGAYAVEVGPMFGQRGGNVQVSTYSNSNENCKVYSWANTTVHVRCYDAVGRPVDSRFVVLAIGREEVAITTGFAPVPPEIVQHISRFIPEQHGFKFGNSLWTMG